MKQTTSHIIISVCLAGLAGSLSAQNTAYKDYIERYQYIAIQQMQKYHIPASVTMAQALVESGAGQSKIAREANNHFGIKCGSDWKGRTNYYDDDARNECFRSYESPYESYEDHSRFLTGKKRYASLFRLNIKDYRGWSRGLQSAGYATNPSYANMLIRLIETYELWRLDDDKTDRFALEKEVATGRQVYFNNKNYYIKVRANDTFKSLAKELGISARKLAKYNERNKNDVLCPGDVLYLKKKQTKADKKYKKVPHVIKAGESMYSIAQHYGIRLKSLYKLNKLSPDYQIKVGDSLRVR